ncbi:MAG TPA: T9SS type A sorting domain-containing protein [Chitinophagaceae bacterium]|mgnify:CR=1 FL=1|nr:T9SS type A sorting domain-containing protein [Chitinophagaceae bacterium]
MRTTIPNCILSYLLLLLALFLPAAAGVMAQNIDFGKSYINVTKGLNGGTVETGDTLEIRATLVVRSGTYDSCRYRDAVPAGTTYIPGTVRVLTNEGKIYQQFTDAYGDDQGWITGTTVTIHLGYRTGAAPATAFRRGRVANTHKPSFFGNTCIMIASFRVRVTALTGNNISTGGGNMTYKLGAAAISTFNFPANTLRVYTNYGICSNSIGANSIGTEFNGTFGSGRPRNRGSSANVPVGYVYSHFDANMPNDYYYGVANNTSTRTGYTTSNSWAIPDASAPSHRVFSVWDIIGDHTGAASPTLGNPPADTVANANGGYMLVINAAYRIDSAFQQTISGLCPNTYYEISCWMRNICSKCGCDSNGKGASNTAGPPYYIPTGTGDSSGVAPNLTFEIDGIDYYTSGNLMYSGQWVKKGFTYLTGAAQTSFTLKFFNNAPGGGGNDWALDDISVSTCSPNMSYSPSLTPIVCDSNILTIYDTVRSFFNNYTYYKWQRSTDGGANWTDVTAPSGPSVPFWNGTAWEYVTSYTVPTSETLLANNGDLYRLVVATTSANLSNPLCNFTDVANIITLNVIDCGVPLAAQLLSFSGQQTNGLAGLKWTTTDEEEPLQFDIEKSTDGIHFAVIGSIGSHQDYTTELQQYTFTDPAALTGKTYYRINMRNLRGQSNWSRTIQLSTRQEALSFVTVINPFSNELQVDIAAAKSGKAEADLIDASGKIVRHKTTDLLTGVTRIKFENTSGLAPGMYFLRIRNQDGFIQKTVLKTNQ